MKIIDRVRSIVATGWDDQKVGVQDNQHPATIEKMILMAYEIGREDATKDVSDQYTAMLSEIRDRADKCRYYRMAGQVVGDQKYIQTTDYAGRVTEMFGGDPADI